MYKRILIAIDDSYSGQLLIHETVKLVENQPVKIKIIHVADESFTNWGWAITDETRISILKHGENIITEMQSFIKDQALECETELVELYGSQYRVEDMITHAVNSWKADLLIIGTHGRSGFNHLFLGSVAEKVIRMAQVPILLVRIRK